MWMRYFLALLRRGMEPLFQEYMFQTGFRLIVTLFWLCSLWLWLQGLHVIKDFMIQGDFDKGNRCMPLLATFFYLFSVSATFALSIHCRELDAKVYMVVLSKMRILIVSSACLPLSSTIQISFYVIYRMDVHFHFFKPTSLLYLCFSRYCPLSLCLV